MRSVDAPDISYDDDGDVLDGYSVMKGKGRAVSSQTLLKGER